MASSAQPTMVAGPVQYKRKYTLWVLILLIIVCWPVAIIYYFTRDKVPVQEFQTYAPANPPPQYAPAYAPPPAAGARFCPACGAQNPAGTAYCTRCGKAMS